MSRKGILVTLRKNNFFLNLSNFNKNFYLLGLNFLKDFKQLLLKKHVLILNENLNFFCNKLFLSADLFFETSKLKIYKKAKKKITPRIVFLKKNNLIFNLLNSLNNSIKINHLVTNFYIINKNLNKPLLVFLFKKMKIFATQIFERRYSLFMDFVKLTSFYFLSKINLESYLYYITEIFKYLRKKSHSRFFLFLKYVYNTLIFDCTPFISDIPTINGVKIIINGRLRGKPIASSLLIQLGIIPTQTINKNIEFAKGHTFTQKFGVFGFKVWTYKK